MGEEVKTVKSIGAKPFQEWLPTCLETYSDNHSWKISYFQVLKGAKLHEWELLLISNVGDDDIWQLER